MRAARDWSALDAGMTHAHDQRSQMAATGSDGLNRSVAEQVHVVAELRLRNQQLRQRTQAIQQECDAMLKSIAVATAQSQAWIQQAGATAAVPTPQSLQPPPPPPPPPPAQTVSATPGKSFSSSMMSPGGVSSPSLRSPVRAEASVALSASPVRRGQPAAGVPRFQQHRSPILMQSSEASVLSVSSSLRPRLPTGATHDGSATMFTSPAGSHFMEPGNSPAASFDGTDDGGHGHSHDGMFLEFEAGEMEHMEEQMPARYQREAVSPASPAARAATGAVTPGGTTLTVSTLTATGANASATSSQEQGHDYEQEQEGVAEAPRPALSPAGAMLVHRPWKSPARAYESPRRAPGVSFAASPGPTGYRPVERSGNSGKSGSPATKSPFATLPPPEQRFSPDSVYYLARVRPERSSLPHNVSPFTPRSKAVNVSPTKTSQFKERTPWKSSAEFFHSPGTRSTPAVGAPASASSSGRKSASKSSQ